jgi:cytochrome c peroxidase
LHAAKALAQFLRTMISGNSKYDKVRRGEDAFNVMEAEGYTLFKAEGGPEGEQIFLPGGGFVVGQGGADCFHCHSDAAGLFTDEQFHNNGLDVDPFSDPGLGGITGDPSDLGKFKTPTLRNIALSGPYMHDGRFATIGEVIAHYNDGGHFSSTVDPFMKFTDEDATLGLTGEKVAQLWAFLSTLTDHDFVNNPAFADPGTPQ